MRADLDLYARVEHLLGIEDATVFLHERYAETIAEYDPGSVLDIGCGRGGLMRLLEDGGVKTKGIDLSEVMAEEARAAGLNAECMDICEEEGRYDVCVAVFDVLNFMDEGALEDFLKCAAGVLNEGGLLIADINTLHGFRDVAEGTMSAEDDSGFLSVDALYDDDELNTTFTYFSKNPDNSYSREQQTITQYFHPLKFFRKKRSLKLIRNIKISLYDREDKMLLVLKKQT